MFIDEVNLELIAGSGGDGCMAFRREKCVELGGPFGGNGGRGSDIKFVVDEGLNTLVDLRYQKQIKGKKGDNGLGKGKNGAMALDITIKVPLGTIITDLETNLILADLTTKDSEVVVCSGGRGGRGNMAFATHSNPAPSFCEGGEPGEQRKVKVELKLLADVGLVGLPSVGKSTIISKISAAKPKIAAYHFTTLRPNLGVVKSSNSSFVVADLPGLIEGASNGDGLGDQFLKHIERTRVIAHVVDMGGIEGRDPYEDYIKINKELQLFNEGILLKPHIIIANKMDVAGALENLEKFKSKIDNTVEVYEIAAISGDGLSVVIEALAVKLSGIEKMPLYEEEKFESHVLYKFKYEKPFEIKRDNRTFVVYGRQIERLFRMTKFTTDEAAYRFAMKLRRLGVDDELRKLGATDGDTIRILDYEFDFKD